MRVVLFSPQKGVLVYAVPFSHVYFHHDPREYHWTIFFSVAEAIQ
jgi:hypothetical protein